MKAGCIHSGKERNGRPDTGPGAQYGSGGSPPIPPDMAAAPRRHKGGCGAPALGKPSAWAVILSFPRQAQRVKAKTVWPSGHRTSLVQRELSANAD